MKNSSIHPKNDTPSQDTDDLLNKNSSEEGLLQQEDCYKHFNKTLLSSLPYPAMYIRRKDKIILAANEIAIDLGAKVGGHCWREFGQTEFISEKDKKVAQQFPGIVPNEFNIKCSFCRADECIFDTPCQNDTEIKAFGKIWDTYWIKVSDDTFLHYLIDVTEQKQLEE